MPLRIILIGFIPRIDCAAVRFGGLAFGVVPNQADALRSCFALRRSPLALVFFLLKRTKCSEQVEAVEPPVLPALNTAAVAFAEPQSRTTSFSVLEKAATRPAPEDRHTRAMASA